MRYRRQGFERRHELERRKLRPKALDFDDLVYGIHAVDEALAAGETLRTIHLAANRAKATAVRGLLAKAKERKIPVRFEQRAFFERVPFRAHQGVVAIAPPFPYLFTSIVVLLFGPGRLSVDALLGYFFGAPNSSGSDPFPLHNKAHHE